MNAIDNLGISMNANRKPLNAVLLLLLTVYYIGFYHVVRSLPWHESGVIAGMNYNLIAYVLSLVTAFILSGLWLLLGSSLLSRIKISLGTWGHMIMMLPAIGAFYYLWQVYQNESSTPASEMIKVHFLRERFPHTAVIAVMTALIAGAFAFSVCVTQDAEYSKQKSMLRVGYACQVALLCGLLNYGPNTFRNGSWGIFHNHAYTASIIAVMSGAPYDAVNTNIYGHYGILYAPFVWLFGNNYNAIAITISLFTIIIYLCAFLCAGKLIHNHFVYFVTVTAIAAINVTYYKPGQALAVMPHRYLFPMIGLTYIICFRQKIKSAVIRQICDWLISTLAIIFNIETGIGTALSIAAVRLFDVDWERVRRSGMALPVLIIRRVLYQVLYCIVSFASAWLIVDLYNITVGGGLLPLSLFIYPYGSHDYVISNELTLPIPTTKAAYMLHIVTFSYALFSSFFALVKHSADIYSANVEDSALSQDKIATMAIGVSALISLSYFMNRTALGQISICHIHFVLLLGVYSDTWKSIVSRFRSVRTLSVEDASVTMKAGMSAVAFYMLVWFAIEGVFSLGGAVETRGASIWNTDSLKNSLTEFEEAVPEDVLCFGLGMPEIEYSIGRTPEITLSEWSNTNRNSEELILKELDKRDIFVVTEATRLEIPDQFIVDRQIKTEEFTVFAYRRRSSGTE